jgi:hypothetical protein
MPNLLSGYSEPKERDLGSDKMKQPAQAAMALTLSLVLIAATPAQNGTSAQNDAPALNDTPPVKLRQDTENMIGGIGVACTGIAQSKKDPRWPSYPLRIEFANDLREHLIGAQVKVWAEERQIMNVTCWGAWLLLNPPGKESYRIEATIIGGNVPAQNAAVQAPASGQTRIVLEFPGVDA